MSNLIPSGTFRTSIEQAFEDLFDTFARQITFTLYKSPIETIVSLDSNFNSDWNVISPTSDGTVTYTEVKSDFSARIWYLDYEQQIKLFYFEGQDAEGVRANRSVSKVKIQLKADGAEFIKTSKKAIFLGEYWDIISDPKSVGILDFKYYNYILQKQN
jgi:hypothetical protein